jgi:flagellar biosynthesis protein FlhG
MPDQADRLRRLVAVGEPPADGEAPLPPTIVVTGGKGGVGATTVALNLAVAMNQIGYRTALIDAAPYADVAHLAGIDACEDGCLDDVVAGMCEIGEALQTGPAGIRVLAGRAASPESPDRSARAAERLLSRLRGLAAQVDAIVIDTGSGMHPWSSAFWQRAGLALLVTTPNDTAVLDAYATLKRVGPHAVPPDVRVLVNQCDDAAVAADAERRIVDACRRFLGLTIGRAPRLVRHDADRCGIEPLCGWDIPSSGFGRAVCQLGRFAADVLSRHRRASNGGAVSDQPLLEFSPC